VAAWPRAPLARLLGDEIGARRARPDRDDGVLARVADEAPEIPTRAIVEELLALVVAAQEPAAAAVTWLLEQAGSDPQVAGCLHRRPSRPAGDRCAQP